MKTKDEKKHSGAPKQLEGGKRYNVYLDEKTVEAARRMGNGELSLGLRNAVAQQCEAIVGESDNWTWIQCPHCESGVATKPR